MIHRRGPWRNLDDVEIATLEWVDWFNNRRLFEALGNVPPAEAEANHYLTQPESESPKIQNRASTEPGAVHSEASMGLLNTQPTDQPALEINQEVATTELIAS